MKYVYGKCLFPQSVLPLIQQAAPMSFSPPSAVNKYFKQIQAPIMVMVLSLKEAEAF